MFYATSATTLSDGYSCLIMEANEFLDMITSTNDTSSLGTDTDLTECLQPWNVNYDSAASLGAVILNKDYNNLNFLQAYIQKSCQERNSNICHQKSCIIENNFVVNYLKFRLNIFQDENNDESFDSSLKHEIGLFDKDVECPIVGNGGKSEKACCGEYPVRFPYKTMSGGRGCCKNKTFNTFRLACCSDFSVKLVCDLE